MQISIPKANPMQGVGFYFENISRIKFAYYRILNVRKCGLVFNFYCPQLRGDMHIVTNFVFVC
jgi:hypothetical protein